MTIFAALSLAACNGGNNAEPSKPASSSQKPSTSKEKWGDWKVVTPATCGAEGKEERTSDAGNKEERPIPKLAQHTWAEDGDVAASDGGVAYKKIKCSVCNAQGIRIAAAQGEVTYTKSDKQSLKVAPEGCVKLPSNGDSFLLKFNVAEAKTGVIYQRGSMDYWHTENNKNQEKTYYSQNSGNTDATNKVGNFKVEVGNSLENLATVELPDNTTLAYGDMLPEDVGFENIDGTNWSTIGDCVIGSVSLSAGINYIKYTRIDSFNLAVHDFDIVFAAPATTAA